STSREAAPSSARIASSSDRSATGGDLHRSPPRGRDGNTHPLVVVDPEDAAMALPASCTGPILCSRRSDSIRSSISTGVWFGDRAATVDRQAGAATPLGRQRGITVAHEILLR